MKYYVYKVTDRETREFYIGSRSFNGEPIDDKYLGSPYTWKPNFKNLEKIIIREDFINMEEAISFERELILENISNDLNRNYSVPYKRFNRSNLITAKDRDGRIVSISKDDPLFGVEFFGVTKGMVVAKDKDGNKFHISIEDERYLSGELVNVNKGKMSGSAHVNFGKRQINNGYSQILVDMVDLDVYLQQGWILGTLQKNKTTISSHVDTIWINNGIKNMRVSETDSIKYLNSNWQKGRINLKKYEKRK